MCRHPMLRALGDGLRSQLRLPSSESDLRAEPNYRVEPVACLGPSLGWRRRIVHGGFVKSEQSN